MKLKKPKFWDDSKISLFSILLYPISLLFLLISFINKFKSPKNYSIPIICVGNIYIGGTGKTPLAVEIFNITRSLGKNPAFVKKHYDYLKDEIRMLKKIGATFVSKIRKHALDSLEKQNYDVAILDDGFQDYSINKNFSILCFNQKQWIGNNLLIPSGPLREKLSAIKRADCIFINGSKDVNIENKIYKENKSAKIFYANYKPVNLNKFKNKNIYAFSGIGNPSNFFHLLLENNLSLKGSSAFPDHYNYSINDLKKLINIAENNDQILLTTEKDYFRIHEDFKKKIDYLKIELEINNKDNFIELIKKNI
tara:strand:- start:1077 stop:2003 length:927 start_codon:yes stop_codon:yes gene_type:complete